MLLSLGSIAVLIMTNIAHSCGSLRLESKLCGVGGGHKRQDHQTASVGQQYCMGHVASADWHLRTRLGHAC